MNVRDTKQLVNVAVDPPSKRHEVCAVLQYLIGIAQKEDDSDTHVPTSTAPAMHAPSGVSIPRYHPVANLLSLSLMNMNAYVHPAIIYCKFMDWDGVSSFPEKPLFYEDADATTASVLAAISCEVQEIKSALNAACPELDLTNVIPMKQWLRSVYGDPIPEHASFETFIDIVCKKSGRYAGIRHVMTEVVKPETGQTEYIPDTKYRYWTEDVPCGLVVVRGIAQLFDVETPMIKTLILWMQEKMGKEYITADGSVSGAHLGETKAPQRFGLTKETILGRYLH